MTELRRRDIPSEIVRNPPAWTTQPPGLASLKQHPQLGTVALLQSATDLTVTALFASHGPAIDPCDELFESPQCSAAFIARFITIRCGELSDLLAAYRIAICHRSDTSDDF